MPEAEATTVSRGQPRSGMDDPQNVFGAFDDPSTWKGWVTAIDADTGKEAWRFETPAPVLSGITPTAGGVVLAGDMAGTLFALDAKSGAKLAEHDPGGAIGGGVVSYATDRGQRIAVAAGMVSPIWPTRKDNGQIVVCGLPGG